MTNLEPIPDEFFAPIGRLCAAYSFLEVALYGLMFGLMSVESTGVAYLAQRFDARSLLETCSRYCKDRGDREALKFLKSIRSDLKHLQRERNTFVHGIIQASPPDYEAAWVTLRGADAFKKQPLDVDRIQATLEGLRGMGRLVNEFADGRGYPIFSFVMPEKSSPKSS